MPHADTEGLSTSLLADEALSQAEALAIAEHHFSITGAVTLLSGERDQNFLIHDGPRSYVLKVTHPAEDRAAITFQTRALVHLAHADPSLVVPHLYPTLEGKPEAEFRSKSGAVRTARLISFLPGVMMASITSSAALLADVGRTLARFDKALADFDDPASSHDLSWDIRNAGRLRSLLGNVRDATNRRRVEQALDAFETFVQPRLASLRKQVIHNDLTPFNILVEPQTPDRVSAVLDFGDMVRAPLVNDVAIAASYHFPAAGDALAPLVSLIGAYAAENPLRGEEVDLLADLIAIRMAMTILISETRVTQSPGNTDYILKNHPAACRGLARLDGLTREEAQARFRSACGLEV